VTDDGEKLVTDAMIEAGEAGVYGMDHELGRRADGRSSDRILKCDLTAIYTAMHSARPIPADDAVERDALVAAYKAGALAVHQWWADAPPEERSFAARDENPDFTEAAYDYAAALHQPKPLKTTPPLPSE
jgi:hypothetical protein